jgi:hypothetical protein
LDVIGGVFAFGGRGGELLGGLAQEGVAVEKAFCYALEGALLDSEEAGGVEGVFGWLGEDAVVVGGHCGG